MYKNIAVIGSNGAIGNAFVEYFCKDNDVEKLYTFSRTYAKISDQKIIHHILDYNDENSIHNASELIPNHSLDLVIVASGILHTHSVFPEKSLKEISQDKFQEIFYANTIFPTLIAKHFSHKLYRDKKATLAFLSARVGSISDNYLGGWYAYRASKAALNMMIKNISIELQRKNKQSIIVGLHPGTVDSNLSKPFQNNITIKNILSPAESVKNLIEVL